MRILALDHGTKRIGVAVSDELRMMAHPLEYIDAEPFAAALERIRVLVREKEVEIIVVGMPRNMDGSYGEAAARTKEFVNVLRDAIPLPIRTWDERLSSVAANRALSDGGVKKGDRKQKVDAMAAAILLQGFLDSLGPM
jgi:putative Holliday junction resolvase